MPSDVIEQMRTAFRAEALDLLIELDSALLALEETPNDTTLVHRVFRAIHTIKGSGATAGFAQLARFAHRMEESFHLAREGRLAVSPELIDCGLRACDVIRLIIENTTEGAVVPGEVDVTAAFTQLLPVADQPEPPPKAADTPKPAAQARAAFQIILRPKREIFYSGSDPVTLLDDLRELGQAHVTAHADQVPPLPTLEAEHCYLWWEILLVTEHDPAAIREVFVFVEDECDLLVRLLDDQAGAVALLGSVPAEAFELFVAESEEHLEDIESDALALEIDPSSKDHLGSLFRGVHSIKGNAGLLSGQVKGEPLTVSHPLLLLIRVAHGLESLLDPFREANAGPVLKETIQITLESCDAIRTLLANVTHKDATRSVSPELLVRLGIRAPDAPSAQNANSRAVAFLNTTSQCTEMIEGCLRRLESGAGPSGPVVETWLRGLRTLSAAARYQNCPELEEPVARQLRVLNAAMSAGGTLSSEDRSALGSAFQSVRSVLARLSPIDETDGAPPTPETVQPVAVPDRSSASAAPSTVRIDQNKLDRLMRVVGELLVARGAFPLLAGRLNAGADGAGVAKDLKVAGADISRMADELQACVMSLRMLPVKTIFQKFPRLVRDLARSLEKEVRLVIEGEGIELDKTILEQIGDPLVHLIRNAVDHGLEPPEERRAKGKDPCGQLTLRALHQAGAVVIEVADDGRGLDAGALKRKAVTKGLLTDDAAAAMSEEAAFQLVFLPGLTTAAKVTDVSGRGVGMDVVRSNVRNLQGSIEIRSKRDRGSAILVKLPTSLMISKGILLEACTQEYILPLSNIRDMVKLPSSETHSYRGLTLAQVRGNVYPLFTLSTMLGMTPSKNPELSVAIVEAGAVEYGLVVDKFVSEVEVLIKPLSGGLEQCKEFQGAAIMGDGRVVLVLNALECHSLYRTTCN